MKKAVLLIIFPVLLSSCTLLPKKPSYSNNEASSSVDDEPSSKGPHEHTFATEWSYDDEMHWHQSTCEHTYAVDQKENHQFSDWIIDKEPTDEMNGSKHKACTVCNYCVYEDIPAKNSSLDKLSFELNSDKNSYSVGAINKDISGTITIPNYYNGLPVTEIKANGFEECSNVNCIIISDGIQKINNYAFFGSFSVTRIEIPDSVTYFGEGAFSYCMKLEELYIPKGINDLSSNAFVRTVSLVKYIVSENNKCYCSVDGVIYSKNKKILHRYPAGRKDGTYTILDGTEELDTDTFVFAENLKSVIMPDSVTTVRTYCFSACERLQSITLSKNIEMFNGGAFEECPNLKEINVPDDSPYLSTIDGVLFNKDHTRLLLFPVGKNIKNYQIPNGVVEINSYSFNMSKLEKIIIPNSVEIIGVAAFRDCKYLDNVVIPEKVTIIDGLTFDGCESLTNIYLPSTITAFHDKCFTFCKFTTVKIPASLNYIGRELCHCCPNIERYVVEEGNTVFYEIDGVLFSNVDGVLSLIRCPTKGIDSYEIPDGISRLHYGSFGSCYDIKNIIIPTSISFIDAFVFDGISSSIEFSGTIEQFEQIKKEPNWNNGLRITYIKCSDGNYVF